MVEKKYCTAPWVNGVFKAYGDYNPCCHARYSYGNWLENGLIAVWHSDAAVKLRQAIIDGEFINYACGVCHSENRPPNLSTLLYLPYSTHLNSIRQMYPQYHTAISGLRGLFNKKELDENDARIMLDVFAALESLELEVDGDQPEIRMTIGKLRVIATVIRDFLIGQVKPVTVSPVREINIISVCNARCIQCPGKFSGEIEHGLLLKGGVRIKEIEYSQVLRALTKDGDILNFFLNGSELFLYSKWKALSLKLRDAGARIRLCTNAMALTESNARFLIDNKALGAMNVSMDAATKDLYERIRVNLKFDRVVKNVKYLLGYAAQEGYSFHISFSFCLMRVNFMDLPAFVDLAAAYREAGQNKITVSIDVQNMREIGAGGYVEFMKTAHHSTIDPVALGNAFAEMKNRADARGIPVAVFSRYSLDVFNKTYLDKLLSGENPWRLVS
jgi:sulfatase maturation enzyme AslB (radical SAM superfamily)